MGGLTNSNLLSHSSGGWQSEIKELVELVPFESPKRDLLHASLLGLWIVVFFLDLYMVFPLYLSISKSALLVRTSIILDEGPT